MKNNLSSRIGVHLRIQDSYTGVLKRALELEASRCQFFFIPQDLDRYLKLTEEDKESFLALRREHFSTIYAHTSYWINAATGNQESWEISKNLLKKEIKIGNTLEIDHFVLHGGVAKKHPPVKEDPSNRQAGLQALAKLLNETCKGEPITVLVENTAHGNKSVCSDLQDFIELKNLIDPGVNYGFCLDTAHAFAHGYKIKKTEEFIALLDQTMGLENIKLIHLNDSAKSCGSKIDQHALPGQGLIGQEPLKNLINHQKLAHIPCIVEPPTIELEKLKTDLVDIWETWEK